MPSSGVENWKWAAWGGLAVTLLALYPQLLMWGVRGREWNGAYAALHGDEWVYSAYVQALIDGRPRRNDPYTGRDDQPGRPQPESLYSIQFVPAYVIAVPARVVGISSSTAFIVLGVLAPFFAFLAIFWLIVNLTQDPRLAAAGSVVVLCFGALVAGEGMIRLLSSGSHYSFLPFLRRYQPAATFPLFFVFCTLVWRSLSDRRLAFAGAVAAGLALGILTFSYFYLWTSAVAWLACLTLLWLIAYPGDLRRNAKPFLIILLLALAALVPYFLLLSRRSVVMDAGQKLTLSHAPDLFRIPELLGLAVIVLILFGVVRGRLNWRAPETLFAASFALTPLIVFNQQVITGRSLQPFHYEWFIANYIALVGGVVASVIIWRGSSTPAGLAPQTRCSAGDPALLRWEPRSESAKRPARYRFAALLAFSAILWAAIEVLAPTTVIIRDSHLRDRAAAVLQRLRQLSRSEGITTNAGSETDPRPLVLATDNRVSVMLPTFAPQAVLWASHFDFLHLEPGESRARFYQYLYYTGIEDTEYAKQLGQPMSTFRAAAFGHERVIADLVEHPEPITSEEIAIQVADYQAYYSSFTRERAVEHVLSYTIVPVAGGPDLSNLDRWYQRDKGEQVGDYILYRVQLRP
jgi:hypothetical protein